MEGDKRLLLIRTDGNSRIGAGHVMRCTAIARQVLQGDTRVLFAVSDDVSRDRIKRQGFEAYVVKGDALALSEKDGIELAAIAHERAASAILVDSYAVTDSFFGGLKNGLSGSGTQIAYIDDAYTYEQGIFNHLHAWPVDVLVNYTFGFTVSDYDAVYSREARCLVGPRFAPIRSEFSCGGDHEISRSVHRVLITTGSTNPNGVLERFVGALAKALPNAQLNVVVGNQAIYAGRTGARINILHDVQDMAALMRSCDMAVSTAGSTLYELCATGIPSIAVPIVENQMKNVQGFVRCGAGLGLTGLAWDDMSLIDVAYSLANDEELRTRLSSKASSYVDGFGAARIARCLWAPINKSGRM